MKFSTLAVLKTTLLLLSMILISGCAGSKYLVSDPSFTEPIPIAVLPFENQTTELAVCELARLYFVLGMQEKGYEVLGYAETDSILRLLGITQGGQLSAITAQELHNELGVEGLLYGTLIEAEYSTKAIKKTKKVTVSIELRRNGVNVWQDQETVSQTELGNILNPLAGLAEQVVDKTFEKAFAQYHGHPLEAQAEQVVYKLQDRMPGKRKGSSGWN